MDLARRIHTTRRRAEAHPHPPRPRPLPLLPWTNTTSRSTLHRRPRSLTLMNTTTTRTRTRNPLLRTSINTSPTRIANLTPEVSIRKLFYRVSLLVSTNQLKLDFVLFRFNSNRIFLFKIFLFCIPMRVSLYIFFP